jgi:hypothetical protein
VMPSGASAGGGLGHFPQQLRVHRYAGHSAPSKFTMPQMPLIGVFPYRRLRSNRNDVLCQHRTALSGAFGDLDQIAHRCDQLVNCIWREGSLPAFRADPGIDVGNTHRDATLTVLKDGFTPFFLDVVLTTDRDRFVSHFLYPLALTPLERGNFPLGFVWDIGCYNFGVYRVGGLTDDVQVKV